MIQRKGTVPAWVAIAAATLFLLHAANYLYFFVDDEAIPFVYAQNLLHGKGLSYNTVEGRLEGYSDFLHVLWSTVVLGAVRTAHMPKDSVFFVGKAVSLVCGVGIVILTWFLLRRMQARTTAAVTVLGTLALAAPLALWSCSSLEAVPFALAGTGLLASLMLDWDAAAVVTAVLLVFERIDGFVYAGLLIAAFVVTASRDRRRQMLWRIALPAGIIFVAYQGWRWSYFKDLIPAPVEAKILYKLTPHRNVLVKQPEDSYLMSFVSALGWPAAIVCAAAAAHGLWRGGMARRVALAALPLTVYVAVVGDWMFGFRFFVLLLPLYSLAVANSVDVLAAARPRLAIAACVLTLGYSGIIAARFFQTYARVEEMPSFVRSPSRDLHRFFWPYYGLYEMSRRLVAPGDVIAYNQAGFLPFMLDANNIDDLGVCSRFPADVPTTDLYFTEVGRYVPLTNKRPLRPVNAYFLYEDVQFVMSRTDILFRANHNSIPPALFGGEYTLAGTDSGQLNAVYRRSERDRAPVEPQMFVENLAHVSYLREARIGERQLDPAEFIHELPFLRDESAKIPFTSATTISLKFSEDDERVSAVSIQEVRSSVPAQLRIRLMTRAGQTVFDQSASLDARQSQTVSVPVVTAANQLTLDVMSSPPSQGSLWIEDLRVQGQRRALQRYIAKHLRFPKDRNSND